MKTSTQVVVIGGGVVGASILYHLTKAGWTDVVLVERKELTAGSTWHAAGGMLTLNGDPNIAALQRYTVQLYKDIEEISGVSCGIHQTGELMLADTQERLDWLRMIHARGQYLSMETEMISVAEAKEMLPILEEKHFAGAMWDPVGGHVDPSGVTNAYAAAARMAGAEVYRNTWAHDLIQKNDGTWDVVTEQGTINTEHIVNCGGLWAREVGRMCGIELPILAMEHMYLLTEEIPEIKPWLEATGGFGFGAVDFGGEIYLRAEGGGLLLGTYEQACVPWSTKETPWDFGSQLLAPDLDRLTPSFEVSFAHFPIFNEVGIKQVINGPFTFAPDGNPLIGPIRGQKGHWVACGVMAGLSQGGGVGLAMANWMTTGDPGFDIWGMDVARYGDWTTPGYTQAKVMENYSRRFQISFPNEELPAGRPLYTSPIHERLTEANAVWGASYGLENALWFQEKGKEPIEDVTFKRSNAFGLVGEEVRAVREKVGLMETTGFAKHEFSGSGAREFLEKLVTNKVPSAGRLTLAPMLNEKGMLIGDFTIATLADPFTEEERFLIFGSGVAEGYHHRWFTSHLPSDGSVSYRVLSHEMTGLSIAGPLARDVLASLVEEDVSNEAFRFLDIRPMNVGMVPAIVGRISFSGDLGYEFWVPASLQASLFDLLVQAGEPHGMKLFGLHALNSLRFDKNFGGWATEYRPIYNPWEAGLEHFVKLDKGDFIGREAALAAKEKGVERKLTAFTIDTEDADAVGDEPIWVNGEVVGWVTSGGYAHWSQASCALGYVPVNTEGTFEIEILGKKRLATPLDEPLFDPSGSKMRS
ncbi:MAG TPA: FAD-dependent oxidoreductase [Acidimicrobiales bacterium]|nr:FAD-dependent oxidoreductase [Acidimicrobiales bacterium]